MTRVIILGNGREVRLAAYAAAWRAAKTAPPDTTYPYGLTGWWPVTAAEVLRQFRDGLRDRINRHDPRGGRKMDADWQRETRLAAVRLNYTPRLLIRPTELPRWLRSRVAHRLHTEEDA